MDMTGWWEYLSLEMATSAVGLEETEIYLLLRRNTVAQYITTHPIRELGMAVERHPRAQVSRRWWDQDGTELLLWEGRMAERVMEAKKEDDVEREATEGREKWKKGQD